MKTGSEQVGFFLPMKIIYLKRVPNRLGPLRVLYEYIVKILPLRSHP